MAFAVVSETNLQTYNPDYEGINAQDLARRGLASGFALDSCAKAFGSAIGSGGSSPAFRFVCTTTTAADTGSFVTNMATQTRSVLDPQSSPSNQITRTIGPLAGILTAGTIRPVRLRVKQFTSNTVCDIYWLEVTVLGGATPVVRSIVATSILGTRRAADDVVTLTAAAGSLVATVTHGTGNANITWTVDVFFDDPV